jgi:hypothetical protein
MERVAALIALIALIGSAAYRIRMLLFLGGDDRLARIE